MLSDCENVQTNFVSFLGDFDDGPDTLSFARRVAGNWISGDVADGEDSELHCGGLSVARCLTNACFAAGIPNRLREATSIVGDHDEN